MFNNLHELIATMPDEKSCRDYLIKERWNGVITCPYCGFEKCYVIENGKRFKCASKACYKKFSVTIGTIFEASNIPLNKWFMAGYLALSHKKGISSYQLAKDIGVAQKTAWFHRLRQLMKPSEDIKLSGTVEINETYIGGSIKNKHKSVRDKIVKRYNPQTQKTGVMGLLERGGNVKVKVMEGTKYEGVNLKPLVRSSVNTDAVIITDGFGGYAGLNKEFKQHEVINHAKQEFVRGNFHTNSIEGFWGYLKRSIFGIYHQVSSKHLQRYCDENGYRYNTRKMTDRKGLIYHYRI